MANLDPIRKRKLISKTNYQVLEKPKDPKEMNDAQALGALSQRILSMVKKLVLVVRISPHDEASAMYTEAPPLDDHGIISHTEVIAKLKQYPGWSFPKFSRCEILDR